MIMVLSYLRNRRKIEGIGGNRLLLRRKLTKIALTKFFTYVNTGSIGFQRDTVLAI